MCLRKECRRKKNTFCSIPFMLTAGLLLASAFGLRPGLIALSDYYGKKPTELRRTLNQFDPSRLPSFQQGWEYGFHPASEKDVGTADYVHISFDNQNSTRQLKRAELFVTYYSDPQDKVPHTPEVCSRQAGAVVEKMSTIEIEVPELGPEHPPIQARLLILREKTYKMVDIYFFCVEGKYRFTRDQVRWVLGIPGNQYSYFSKIEAATDFPLDGDPAQALETSKTILIESLPILVSEFFPTKEQLKRRE